MAKGDIKKCNKCGILTIMEKGQKCKECAQKIRKKYIENNKEKILKKNRDWYHNNKERARQKSKEWRLKNKEKIIENRKTPKVKEQIKRSRIKNKDKILEQNKIYAEKTKEYQSERRKKWYYANREEHLRKRREKYKTNKDNPEQILKLRMYRKQTDKKREIRRKWEAEKIKNNPEYKLRKTISRNISLELKKINLTKCGVSCLKFLDYTIAELKLHIENLFESWMNWNNRGNYNFEKWDENDSSTWTWHLDHIIPQCSFDFKDPEQIKACWALSNLRPLRSIDNLRKGNQILK